MVNRQRKGAVRPRHDVIHVQLAVVQDEVYGVIADEAPTGLAIQEPPLQASTTILVERGQYG